MDLSQTNTHAHTQLPQKTDARIRVSTPSEGQRRVHAPVSNKYARTHTFPPGKTLKHTQASFEAVTRALSSPFVVVSFLPALCYQGAFSHECVYLGVPGHGHPHHVCYFPQAQAHPLPNKWCPSTSHRHKHALSPTSGAPLRYLALTGSLPQANAFALVCLVTAIYAIMSVTFFSYYDPNQFGDFFTAMFTLFQVMTGDKWSDIARSLFVLTNNEAPVAIFFVSFQVRSHK